LSGPRILFVCTGNICRSPTAEGVLLHHARRNGLELIVDSAGTSAEELGNPPDARARRVAQARGYILPERQARQVRANHFITFDRILAMTGTHLRALERRAPAETTSRLELFMTYAPEHGVGDVPDPWYGGLADYEQALDLIEAGVAGLLRDLLAAR
jgi:protein-tyrosine phosphatase